MRRALLFLLPVAACAQQWIAQQSHVTVSLRGVSAVNARTVWASGAQGTCLRTLDGGVNWTAARVPGAGDLDFRGIHASSAESAYLMSAGEGAKSRIYKTADGGVHWRLLFTSPDPKGFFDAMAFWDARHGIVLGDPVDGQFTVFTTADGGEHWRREPAPPALPGEGAFAASNTCLRVRGTREAWFATGGKDASRVFYSSDRGRTWTVARTPVRSGAPTTGIFSLAFAAGGRGIAVGGDYAHDKDSVGNIAGTADSGRSWQRRGSPRAYRSAAAYVAEEKLWIVTGTSGSDSSRDDGNTWVGFDDGAFHAMAFVPGGGWAVGPDGRIARYKFRFR